jgi:Flp pilus assembly protein TadB
MSGIYLFTIAMVMGLAATLTLAVYRSLVSGSDKAKFDEALAIIQSSEITELDTSIQKEEEEGGAWSWNKFWYKRAVQSGRSPEDAATPGRYALGAAIVGFVFGFFVFPGGVGGVLVGPAVLGLGYLWLGFEANKRRNTLDKQMPILLSSLRAQMHAGVTVQAALINIADEIPSPLGDEIRQVRQDVNVSIPLEQALDSLASRVRSRQMQFLVSSIGIAVRSGSDLVPQLVVIEEISRQRFRIEGKIKAAVALAKPTAYLAIGAPALMFLYGAITNPKYLPFFFGDGLIFGLGALVAYVLGVVTVQFLIRNVEKT